MNSNFSRIYRSPTPLIRSNLKYNQDSSCFLKIKNISSYSYKKLRKLQISDTNLTFIHKIKDNLLKKQLPKLSTQSKQVDNSTQILSPKKPDELFDKVLNINHIKSIIDNLINTRTKGTSIQKNERILTSKRFRYLTPGQINKSNEIRSVTKYFKIKPYIKKPTEIKSQGIQVGNHELSAWEADFDIDDE